MTPEPTAIQEWLDITEVHTVDCALRRIGPDSEHGCTCGIEAQRERARAEYQTLLSTKETRMPEQQERLSLNERLALMARLLGEDHENTAIPSILHEARRRIEYLEGELQSARGRGADWPGNVARNEDRG